MAKALNQIETRHTRRVRFEFKEVDRELVDRCEKRLQDEVERLTGFKFAVTEGQVMGKKGVVIFVRRMDLSESIAKLIPKSSAEMPAKPPPSEARACRQCTGGHGQQSAPVVTGING